MCGFETNVEDNNLSVYDNQGEEKTYITYYKEYEEAVDVQNGFLDIY